MKAPKVDVKEMEESVEVVEFYKDTWKRDLRRPDSARPVISNRKFRQYIDEIAASGVIPGFLTVAVLPSGTKFLVDGWHRMSAFDRTPLASVYAEVKNVKCKNERDMAKLFLAINEPIRAVTVGDKLRAFYGYDPDFRKMIDSISFVSFTSNVASISVGGCLRAFLDATNDRPGGPRGSLVERCDSMTDRDRRAFASLMRELYTAWGEHGDVVVLWRGLNLSVLMWFWERMVNNPADPASRIQPSKWRELIDRLGRDEEYKANLRTRTSNQENMAEVYDRLASLIRRIAPHADSGEPIRIPKRTWATPDELLDLKRRITEQKAIEKKRDTGKRDKAAHQRRKYGGHQVILGAKRK